MGITRTVTSVVGGSLADQWLEVIKPGDMGDQMAFTSGRKVRRGQNIKGTKNAVSSGSVIHVYPNQFTMLVDDGKVVDCTTVEGYCTVKGSALPSLFNGEFGGALGEAFDRVRSGGVTPTSQEALYVNLQEIKGIKLGIRNPINYFDQFYNAKLFLRAHGTYLTKVTNPLLFYVEVIPKNAARVQVDDINAQYLDEFLEASQTSINQISADGTRVSFVASKGRELGKYMVNTLDEDWDRMRGIEVQSMGVASTTYDEESQKLINMRNQGMMSSDPTVREGYVQGATVRGTEAAGSNANGAMAGSMGMGVGMGAAGGFLGNASAANLQQMQTNQAARAQQMNRAASAGAGGVNMQLGGQPGGMSADAAIGQPGGVAAGSWTYQCGTMNAGKSCSEYDSPKPAPASWTRQRGTVSTGKFCSECGKPKAQDGQETSMATMNYKCPSCGGGLIYEPESGQYQCEYCLSELTQQKLEEMMSRMDSPQSGETATVILYHCPSCGVEIVTDEAAATTFCFYCHNPVVLSGRLEGRYHSDYVLPFAVDRERAVEIFMDWVQKKRYVPKSFFSKRQIEKTTGMYLPCWLYSCKAGGVIEAEGMKLRTWITGSLQYTEIQKYEIRRNGHMNINRVPRDVLKKADRQLVEGVLPYNIKELRPFSMGYLSELMAEKRDMEREAFVSELNREVIDSAATRLQNSVSGYEKVSVRNRQVDIRDEKWQYALMPVWMLTYRDNSGKICYFACNGQTGKVCRQLLMDIGRLMILFAEVFLPLLAVLLVMRYLL